MALLRLNLLLMDARESMLLVSKDQGGPAELTEQGGRLMAKLSRLDVGLLVVDTMVEIHNVPESDNTALHNGTAVFRRHARATGSAVLMLHHLVKPDAGGRATLHSLRGASALAGVMRSCRLIIDVDRS